MATDNEFFQKLSGVGYPLFSIISNISVVKYHLYGAQLPLTWIYIVSGRHILSGLVVRGIKKPKKHSNLRHNNDWIPEQNDCLTSLFTWPVKESNSCFSKLCFTMWTIAIPQNLFSFHWIDFFLYTNKSEVLLETSQHLLLCESLVAGGGVMLLWVQVKLFGSHSYRSLLYKLLAQNQVIVRYFVLSLRKPDYKAVLKNGTHVAFVKK